MASKDGTLASPGFPYMSQEASKNLDIEMTAPLTSLGESSNTSSPFVSAPLEDMNSFQSAKDRNDRLNGVRAQFPPLTTPTSPWRRENQSASSTTTSPSQRSQSTSSRQRSHSIMSALEEPLPLSKVIPGPVWPTEDQLKVAYTYGIRRDDGTYTMLIRADQLSEYDFQRVPTTQGPQGMIVLPPPYQLRPEQREGQDEMVPTEILRTLPSNRPRRPTRTQHQDINDETQMQIDNIVAASKNSPTPTRRREKIYCDKWIHEGVCAFTQLGCKYKHEMPTDKATQLSLGLNHGIPNWYKRAQAAQLLQSSPPGQPQLGRSTEPWRRTPGPVGSLSSSPLGSSSRSSYGPSNFGPIGSSRPFSSLSSTDQMSEDAGSDEGEIVYHGRRH